MNKNALNNVIKTVPLGLKKSNSLHYIQIKDTYNI